MPNKPKSEQTQRIVHLGVCYVCALFIILITLFNLFYGLRSTGSYVHETSVLARELNREQP